MRRFVVALAVATVGLIVVIVVIATRADNASRAGEVQTPGGFRGNRLPPEIVGSPAPNFRLRDARGGYVDTRAWRGRPYIVTFLYTNCPDVCPIIGQEIRQAFERLGPSAQDVSAVAVSVDPRGDTAEAVRVWLNRQRLPANFRYAIGTEGELKPVWKSYYAAPQIPGDPESAHTTSIWLIDARGRIRTKYSGGAPVAPADVAHDLRLLLYDRVRSPEIHGKTRDLLPFREG
jgi:protein SCO1/2